MTSSGLPTSATSPRGAPRDPRRPPGERAPEPGAPARRLAGALLLANALLVLLDLAVRVRKGTPGMPVAGGLAIALVGVALGVGLLWRPAALALWGIIGSFAMLIAGSILAPGGAMAFLPRLLLAGGIVTLLVGEAKSARVAIGASVVGLALVIDLGRLLALGSGGASLASWLLVVSGQVESGAVKTIQGRKAPYTLTFPNESWRLRKEALMAKENPVADRWFVRPDKDAHILVVAEQTPGSQLEIEAYTDAIVENLKKETTGAKVLYRAPWPKYPTRGRLLKMEATRDRMTIVWSYGMVVAYDRAYFVVAFATPSTMIALETELRQILDSFELPKEVLDAVSPDLQPEPVALVKGIEQAYTVTPPGPTWRLRRDEDTKKKNAIIDRWLTEPNMDAHLVVIAEEVEAGATLTLEDYVKAVLDSRKQKAKRFEESGREPWKKFPGKGTRLHASVTQEETELEYEFGLYTDGKRAFQVNAFVTKGGWETAKADLERAVESFVPPP